jgi:hypothetical protein
MKRTGEISKIKLSRAEIRKIIAQQKKEFPGDFALQQVHIARGIIAKEAEKAGMNYVEYIMYCDRLDGTVKQNDMNKSLKKGLLRSPRRR